jgi:outer membrane protein OmpA-like peptidoglycan-associated protein
VNKGIGMARMDSEGVGEARPIDTNRTPSGRANNRRVEFHIVDDK